MLYECCIYRTKPTRQPQTNDYNNTNKKQNDIWLSFTPRINTITLIWHRAMETSYLWFSIFMFCVVKIQIGQHDTIYTLTQPAVFLRWLLILWQLKRD